MFWEFDLLKYNIFNNLLSESIELRPVERTKKDGSGTYRIIYVELVGETLPKETFIKMNSVLKKHRATFFGDIKKWGWFISNDPATAQQEFDNKIKPAYQEVMQLVYNMEGEDNMDNTQKDANGKKKEYIDMCEKVRKAIESNDISAGFDKTSLLNQLDKVKMEIVKSMTGEEFEARLKPIINALMNSGYQYSIINTILIYLQKPNVQEVKTANEWKELNRAVNSDATKIAIWRPKGGRRFGNKQDREKVIQNFLQKCRVNSVDELTIQARQRLEKQLKFSTNAQGFDVIPCLYDITDTHVMEGMDDKYEKSEYKWHDYDTEPTETTSALVDAAILAAQSFGIKVIYDDDETLGKANGYANGNGEIHLKKNAPRNQGYLNTAIHETAHELLHFDYAHKENDLKDLYVGRESGRQLVEQQAEMCAMVVMMMLGIPRSEASTNYVIGWGATPETVTIVFDTITRCAQRICKEIKNNYENALSQL